MSELVISSWALVFGATIYHLPSTKTHRQPEGAV